MSYVAYTVSYLYGKKVQIDCYKGRSMNITLTHNCATRMPENWSECNRNPWPYAFYSPNVGLSEAIEEKLDNSHVGLPDDHS